MKKLHIFTLSLLLLCFMHQQTDAQKKVLSLDDGILNPFVYPKNIGAVQFIPSTSNVTVLNSDRKGLSFYNAKGKQKELLSVDDLNTALKLELQGMPAITWVDENSFYFRLQNAFYSYNLESKTGETLVKFPDDAENIDFHYSSKQVAFTRGNNLFIASNQNPETQVSKIAETQDIVCGQAIARFEFGIGKGTFWSPKGSLLAFYQKNETDVADYPLLDISSTPGTLKSIKYPMAGQKSEYAQVGVFNPATGRIIYLRVNGERDQYLTNLAWGPEQKFLYVAIVNRAQNHMWLNKYDATDGRYIKTLFDEKHEKYVEPENPVWFLPNNNNEFLWMSERDGFMHLYRYNAANGQLLQQLTKGKFVVDRILGMGPDNNSVIFMGTDESGLEMHAYRVDLKSTSITKITKADGQHRCTLSSNGKMLIDSYSNLEKPRVVQTINLKGKVKTTLLDAKNPLENYQVGSTEILTLKANDGTDLHARMIKPSNFDPNKKYPVLVYVYGGPHAQMVTNSWLAAAPLWMHTQAEKGYIIFTLDNRGSKNRGFEFENIIHRQLGTIEMEDQMVGVEYLKKQAFVDADRMAVHGWSFGGFMTISMMLRKAGTFKVGVAGGPVTDWKYYEIMYGERYMDQPKENPEGYKEACLMNHVQNLQGDLLLIHGTIDDVVVMQHNLALVKAFVDNGTLVDFFPYPGHPHNVRGKDRIHLMKKVLTYIDEKLK